MKAITLRQFGSTDNFAYTETDTPAINDNDVLVKIYSTAFNPIDYQMRLGASVSQRMHSHILGREFSGVIANKGRMVKDFEIGDEVFCASGSMGSNGTYAEYISVPQQIIARKPANISFEEAAALPISALTAMQCCNRLKISPEESVFISGGAGGVGLVLIKILLSHGINKIVTIAGNPGSRQELINAGLRNDQIVDYKAANAIPLIIQANRNQLFDFCIDLVGSQTSELCSNILRLNGTFVDITAFTTEEARENLFNIGAVVVYISNYAYSLKGNFSYYGELLERASALVEKGTITPSPIEVIGGFELGTVKKAHELMEHNQTKGHKLIMRVTE
ncbi:NADP-dependent oxidoreductase [Chitinophaga sp. S165]|uniref:NADP-dependent oxidoreductase n=1 Tax=Chitinophaga sp. S165 TaxID=2135462 RepID=UPI000D71591E|nr:NADP-dependent oxidoreductase [Chitinophaga sp. S165]PWV51699.1 NADPH:quinone reductase-like Zn-dependent oxidoreductase [Chitinophaga sp. S165]